MDIFTKAYITCLCRMEDLQEQNEDLLNGVGDASQASHDFWLTRNGHSTGFWDRGTGALGDLFKPGYI